MNAASPRRLVRSIGTALFVVLACIGLLASVLAVWARELALDSDRFARTAAGAVTAPEVAVPLADYVADQVIVVLDDLVDLELPASLEPYAATFTLAVRATVAGQIRDLVTAPTTRTTIEAALRRAHGALIRVLEGDGEAVTINLLPVLGAALHEVQDAGIIPGRITLPDLERGGDPSEQIAALEALTGRDLPASLGQFTIYRGDDVSDAGPTIAAARDALALFRKATVAVVIVTVLLTVGAVLLGVRKRRTLLQLAVGFSSTMILSAWLIDEVQQRLPALVEPEARDAARRIFRDFTYGLLQFTRTVAIVGLVVAGALWLTRREAAQSAIAAVGDAGRALRRRPDAARVAILAAALVALFLFGLSWLGVIITGTILIAGLWTTRTDPADADAART